MIIEWMLIYVSKVQSTTKNHVAEYLAAQKAQDFGDCDHELGKLQINRFCRTDRLAILEL